MNSHDNDLLFAMRQRNLVYNADLRQRSNPAVDGNSIGIPDGYVYQNAGAGAVIDAAAGQGIAITIGGDGALVLSQNLHEFPGWRQVLPGHLVTATINVDIPVETTVDISLALTDGIRTHTNTWSNPDSGLFSIDIDLTVAEDATRLSLTVTSDSAGASFSLLGLAANRGSIALPELACQVSGVIGGVHQYVGTQATPITQLNLCEVARELSEDETRLDTVLNGRFGRGNNSRSLLPDLRGYFLRAWDNGAPVDPDAGSRTPLGKDPAIKGDMVGTKQEDEIREHRHDIAYAPDALAPSGNTKPITPITQLKTGSTEPFGGNETRGKNVAVMYTISWA
ncbi:MAG: hypothetical protein AAF513_03835 [Pseudomonadota bacterium]